MVWFRGLFIVVGLLLVAVGVAGVLMPDMMADTTGLWGGRAPTGAGMGETRALYVIHAGMGIAMMMSWKRARTEGLKTLALIFFLMAAARGISLFADRAEAYTWIRLMLEVGLGVLCMAGVQGIRQLRT